MTYRAQFVVGCLVFGLASPSFAAAPGRTLHAGPDDYRELLADLKPGDTLQLAPGQYRRGLPVHRLAGSADQPITIRGPANGAPGEPAVLVARPRANTVSILDAAYIHIRDLTLDGRGIAVDAVKAEGHARWAHHITLENLTIVNHGNNQQNVAISTKCPAWGWVVRGNRIFGAGTGMYFGNSDGSAAFFDSLIEHNLVIDPLGYAIQIKHQHARPSFEHAPRGRRVTVIRHNVLSKANGDAAGGARPNLLVGHWPLAGEGASDEYHIYGNLLLDNPHEALFQGEGTIALYANVLINRHGPALHIQPHNDVPRGIRIFGNTVIASADGIVVRTNEKSAGYTQVIAGNAVFALRPLTGGTQIDNATYPFERVEDLLGSASAGHGIPDPYPQDERLRCAPVQSKLLEGLTEGSCDFNGRSRSANYCGAYTGSGRNPGWTPALEVKPRTICRAR